MQILPFFKPSHEMPPNASADNGGFAWFVTVRPRPEHFTDELIADVKKYIQKIRPDWHIAVIEKGSHIHVTYFMHEPAQRSNVVTNWLNNPLKGFKEPGREDEKELFRRAPAVDLTVRSRE